MGVAADVLVNICACVFACVQRVGMVDCASVSMCVCVRARVNRKARCHVRASVCECIRRRIKGDSEPESRGHQEDKANGLRLSHGGSLRAALRAPQLHSFAFWLTDSFVLPLNETASYFDV